MESLRKKIEARHCDECGKVTPHEVKVMVARSLAGVTQEEVGASCTRCTKAG
jgi:hypothetical protein